MSLKVLLVDDDKMVLFLHKILVESSKLPPAPLSFMNGREAFDFLVQNKDENFQYLILLDINMPEMNGWDFLNSMQNEPVKEKIFVCLVTSSINHEDREKASGYEQVIEYIEKPLSAEICNLIEEKFKARVKL